MSFDLRAALRDTDGLVVIPPGTFTFSEPLVVPDRHIVIRGAGMALTSLIFTGEGTSGFTAQRSMVTSPLEISDMTLMTTAKKGGTAIDVRYVPVGASHDPSLLLERVRIRSAPGNEGIGAWSKGIVLAGAWSPIISRVWIQGRSSDMTKTDLLTSPMECAIDVGGSQEAKITYAQIACSQIGVRVTAPAQGKGEGFHFTHSAIVHAITALIHNNVIDRSVLLGVWLAPKATVCQLADNANLASMAPLIDSSGAP